MTEETKDRGAQVPSTVVGAVAPIVHDVARPAAQEIGKFAGHTVRALLLPLSKVLNLWEATIESVASEVEDILKGIPQEQLGEPAGYIAGPALETLRYTMDEGVLRSLYANLLATAIHVPSASRAHPSFVDIIKQLSPLEARMLQSLAEDLTRPALDLWVSTTSDDNSLNPLLTNVVLVLPDDPAPHGEVTQVALQNLLRLGLVQVLKDFLFHPDQYAPIENHPVIREIVALFEDRGGITDFRYHALAVTSLGHLFIECCVKGPGKMAESKASPTAPA